MLAEAVVGRSAQKRLLVCVPVPGGCVGTQPQSDVLRLHRLPHHSHQIGAQSIEVRLVSKLGGEALKRLSRVILLAVEAPFYERLYTPSQRVEQGCYHEGGGHHREGGLLACEDDEEPLQHYNDEEVECNQRGSQSAVDERAVDDHVYVEQMRVHNRNADGEWDEQKG